MNSEGLESEADVELNKKNISLNEPYKKTDGQIGNEEPMIAIL